jgi:hypothetical protein
MDPSSNRGRDGGRGYSVAAGQSVGESVMWTFAHRVDEILERLEWVPKLVLLAALVMIGIQAADRRAPFEVLRVEPASARPGEIVMIYADVRRDTGRVCSADLSRSVFDSRNVRFDYPQARFSAEVIAGMERAHPGRLQVAVMVPPGAAAGLADLVNVLSYRCNQVQALWPIEVTIRMPFTVLE